MEKEQEEGGNGLSSIHMYIYTHTFIHKISSEVAVTFQVCEQPTVAALKLRHVKVNIHPRLFPYFLLNQLADISDVILSLNC